MSRKFSLVIHLLTLVGLYFTDTAAIAQTARVDLKKSVKVKVVSPKTKPKLIPKPKPKVNPKKEPQLNQLPKKVKIEEPIVTPIVVPTETNLRPIEPLPERSELNWSGVMDYKVRTDLADRAKPRLYVHTLGLSYGFEHNPSKISVGASLGATYSSLGERRSEVIVNSNDAELFINDVDLSVGKTWELPAQLRLSINLDNEFPTSPEARREGYNSVTSLAGDLRRAWFEKRLSMGIATGVTYIWNTYRYSPATTDINQQSGSSITASGKFKIWRGWFVNASAGAKISTYVDGTSDRTYRNSIGTGYSWERLTISASYSNGTYLDQNDASLWFIDEYRRTASGGFSYSF